MAVAGELTQAQTALLFAHMPVGFSVADEGGVVRFWAETPSPVAARR